MTDIKEIIDQTEAYNLHNHTQFCDGRSSMDEICQGASAVAIKVIGFTPHSPITVESPCNMGKEDVEPYLSEIDRLSDIYHNELTILSSMEIDYLGHDWGAHIDYFQDLPLEYRLSSVHFVPTQDGRLVDCDGSPARFARYVTEYYRDDLRYVIERYFEQVIRSLEEGGFDMLGHFDKIYRNAVPLWPELQQLSWYQSLVDDVLRLVEDKDIVLEINTKYFAEDMTFPHRSLWRDIKARGIKVAVNSDAHYLDRIDIGRKETMKLYNDLKID